MGVVAGLEKRVSSQMEGDPFSASSMQVRYSMQKRRLRLYVALLLGDLLLTSVSYLVVAAFYINSWGSPVGQQLAIAMSSLFVLLAFYQGLYSLAAITNVRATVRLSVQAMASALVLYLLVTFFAKTTAETSRIVLTLGAAVSTAMVIVYHSSMISLWRYRQGASFQNVMIVDAGGDKIDLPGAHHFPAHNIDVDLLRSSPSDLHTIGTAFRNMDRVIVACDPADRANWSFVLRAIGVRGEVTSPILREMGVREVQIEKDFTTLLIAVGPLGIRDRLLKRILDLVIALPASIILLPLFVIIAIAIMLESGLPIIFRQRRMGRNNVYFTMYKFRTMKQEKADALGHRSASRDDDRITKVGKFLRRTSLDELPQILNVLAGDMSLVGPRPHAIGSRAGDKLFWEVDEAYWLRHAAKPGMTGLAQIRGFRGATDCEDDLSNRLSSDLEYIANWSPLKDLMIIIKTLTVLIHAKAF
ncbi:sugar transferase [Citromicrobium bathyomarinum]|uniref:sugar transferase n=1 Tax=Citromicrobium bathyomarinum TaxID=72174 RepID=UPI003159D438